jgi:SNF2 family DNA or RNA helicase
MSILTEYHFPVVDPKKPAFDIQKKSCAVMVGEYRDYNLNDLGTGKTRCALWSFDYLRKKQLVKRMLVVCPLSTMNRVWEREILTEFTDLTCAVLHGSREQRLKQLNRNVNIYIINHDGLKTIYSELLERTDINVICIDEIAAFRNMNPRSARVKRLAHNKKYVWGMTGSPMPREVTDVWSQCCIVTPNTVPKYFSWIRAVLMTKGPKGPYDWVPRPNAEAMAINYMKPAVRFTIDEVTELPSKVMQYHEVPMSAQQTKIYNEIRTKAVSMIGTKIVDALNAGAAIQKLLQIACGYVYTREEDANKNRETITLDNSDRLQYTLDLIDSTSRKAIVFVPYLNALNGVSAMLTKNKVDHAVVYGGITKTHRNLIFSAFQDTAKYKVLLAHPVCMSHGLTLTAANTIIWFGPTLSLDTFYQANGRITRLGQEHKQVIAMLGGTKVERRIYTILAENEKVQAHFLDIIKSETERQMAAE